MAVARSVAAVLQEAAGNHQAAGQLRAGVPAAAGTGDAGLAAGAGVVQRAAGHAGLGDALRRVIIRYRDDNDGELIGVEDALAFLAEEADEAARAVYLQTVRELGLVHRLRRGIAPAQRHALAERDARRGMWRYYRSAGELIPYWLLADWLRHGLGHRLSDSAVSQAWRKLAAELGFGGAGVLSVPPASDGQQQAREEAAVAAMGWALRHHLAGDDAQPGPVAGRPGRLMSSSRLYAWLAENGYRISFAEYQNAYARLAATPEILEIAAAPPVADYAAAHDGQMMPSRQLDWFLRQLGHKLAADVLAAVHRRLGDGLAAWLRAGELDMRGLSWHETGAALRLAGQLSPGGVAGEDFLWDLAGQAGAGDLSELGGLLAAAADLARDLGRVLAPAELADLWAAWQRAPGSGPARMTVRDWKTEARLRLALPGNADGITAQTVLQVARQARQRAAAARQQDPAAGEETGQQLARFWAHHDSAAGPGLAAGEILELASDLLQAAPWASLALLRELPAQVLASWLDGQRQEMLRQAAGEWDQAGRPTTQPPAAGQLTTALEQLISGTRAHQAAAPPPGSRPPAPASGTGAPGELTGAPAGVFSPAMIHEDLGGDPAVLPAARVITDLGGQLTQVAPVVAAETIPPLPASQQDQAAHYLRQLAGNARDLAGPGASDPARQLACWLEQVHDELTSQHHHASTGAAPPPASSRPQAGPPAPPRPPGQLAGLSGSTAVTSVFSLGQDDIPGPPGRTALTSASSVPGFVPAALPPGENTTPPAAQPPAGTIPAALIPGPGQQAALAATGLVLLPVPADTGDCLMTALIMAAPEVLAPGTTTRQVRDRIVTASRDIIDNPSHRWHQRVDHAIRDGLATERTSQAISGHTLQGLDPGQHHEQVFTSLTPGRYRDTILERLGTPATSAGPHDDITPYFAAIALQLNITIITPGGQHQISTGGRHDITLVHIPVPGHWHATAPLTQDRDEALAEAGALAEALAAARALAAAPRRDGACPAPAPRPRSARSWPASSTAPPATPTATWPAPCGRPCTTTPAPGT